jgi:hemerythrin
MSIAVAKIVSCSWKDFRFIDLLENLILLLKRGFHTGDYDSIDQVLDYVECLMFQRFSKEEKQMHGDRFPLMQAHVRDHQFALKKFKNAHKRWKRDRDQMQLIRFLEQDYCDWYAMHQHFHDFPAHRYAQKHKLAKMVHN